MVTAKMPKGLLTGFFLCPAMSESCSGTVWGIVLPGFTRAEPGYVVVNDFGPCLIAGMLTQKKASGNTRGKHLGGSDPQAVAIFAFLSS